MDIQLSEIETACGVTIADVEALALTSTVSDDMAVIDQFATPAQAGAVARHLLGGPVEFSHLAMGAYPVYRREASAPVAPEPTPTPEPGYVSHDLSPEDVAKVPAGPFTMLTYPEMIEALSAPSGERPRVYGYLIPEGDQRYGQLTRLASLHYVERYADRLAFAWVSGTTVANMIGRA